MECASERSGDGGSGLNEEKRSEHSIGDDHENHHHKQDTDVEELPMANNKKRSMVEAESSALLAKKKKVDDQLETTKAQMDEVKEENQRLRMNLNKIMNEYRALEIKFHNMVKQEIKKNVDKGNDFKHSEMIEESDVSLSLGRVPSNPRNDKKMKVSKPPKDEEFKEDLSLGLDYKFETSKSGSTTESLANIPSPVNSFEVPKEKAGETWPPSKALKTMRDIDQDEVAQQTPAKKTRVCVRARCDTPTMNDGCQWRKYGQKIAKGNPCPRAYYRCTIAPTCPVRKQVQRCVDDMSILITTYEGTHNHTLPLSATAMASTTSAAASMLLSGSSSSTIGSMPSTTTTTTNNNNNNNLNFYLSSDCSKSNQLYLSNPTLSSSSQSHPTITLDLTSNPGSSSSPFLRFTSGYNKYPSSTSLSFSSPESNTLSWNNHNFLNYGTHQLYNNKNNLSNTVNFGRTQNMYQTYMQMNNNSADTISAATKAITTDPTFQSALAAALSSFIGGIGSTQAKQGAGENLGPQKMKLEEMFPASSTLPSTSKINGCGSSFLNKTPTKTQTGSLMLLSPALPLSSASKSASASPRDNSDNTN